MSFAAAGLAHRVDQEQAVTSASASGHRFLQVLLLPPNLVGHLRLLLLAAAVASGGSRPALAFWLIAASLVLDALDGWLARRLQQQTAFGAFYDVCLDNCTRAVLWVGAVGGSPARAAWAALILALEGITFACTHAGGGAAWKTGCFRDAPLWVQAVMRFSSPPGALAVAGLMGCPLWLWARRNLPPGSLAGTGAWGLLVVPGRALAAAVECWVVQRRAQQLLQEDAAAQLRRHM